MARDVEYAVTASDKTGTALASAEAKFKATQDRIKKDSDKATEGLTRMGSAGAQSVTKLRKELEVAEGDLKKLALAFANAGSASERIDISKKIRTQESDIGRLRKTVKLLGGDLENVGSSLFDSLKSGPAVGAAVAAAAPFIGASISAAVIG